METLNLHRKALVIENIRICVNHYHIAMRDDVISKIAKPGQFVNLRINKREDLLLRRPFSVAITRPEQNSFEIVYRVVGKGTSAMTQLRPGEEIDLLGPLGTGFHLPETPMNCLLLGGGTGVATLWGLADHLFQRGNKIVALLGFRSLEHMFSQNIFERYHAKIIITTEDGSYGLKGLVSDPLEEILKLKIDHAYVCGPTSMLKAVIPLIKKANIKGEVSIEEKMGCGYGVCLSCVVPILKNGEIERQRVCVEGPVFRLEEIVLDHGP